jgi:hypothetical protein
MGALISVSLMTSISLYFLLLEGESSFFTSLSYELKFEIKLIENPSLK